MAINKSKRNGNSGTHPSYDKRGMTPAQIEAKKKRDKAYNKKTVDDRVDRNRKRREQVKKGNAKVGDKKDYDHAKKKMVPRSENRGRNSKNGGTAGDKRARG